MTKEKIDPHEEAALNEVAYGTQHALNILLDILIDKGIISEQEFIDKLELEAEEIEQNDKPEQ